jgi:hypothetical protein
MKHRFLLITTLALLLVLLVAGTAQADTFRHHVASGGAPSPARAAAPSATGGVRLAAPLNPFGVVGTGAAVLNGTVYSDLLSPVNGAIVDWYAPVSGIWNTGEFVTGADGAYSFTNADAASGQGELWAMSPGTSNWFGYERYNASWSDPGPTTFDFQAGIVPLTAYRGGPWSMWSSAKFAFDGSDAQSAIWSIQSVDPSDTSTTPVIYNGNVPAGAYGSGSVKFWYDEGMEFTPPTVTAGGTASGVTVDEADAQRTTVWSPWWASGKPGTTIKVWMNSFPAGWTVDFSGYSDWPPSAPVKTFWPTTTTGVATQFRTLTVPKTATPGYFYWIGEQHEGGPLYLETPFQVATLKPSASTIRRSGAVTLSGVIPTRGHQGSTPGIRKYVVLYKRATNAGQPHAYSPASKSWTKVATFRASGLGKYTFRQRPRRTTYYVVRYPGDAWYWKAFTSVIHVHVR